MPTNLPSLLFLLLLLLFTLSTPTDPQAEPFSGTEQSQEDSINHGEIMDELNKIAIKYFKNCSYNQEQKRLSDCSMPKEKYPQFLWNVLHKQHIISFIQFYQAQGKIQGEIQLSSMYKIGQKVEMLVISAYQEWIEIVKPNHNITVEEIYEDLLTLTEDVLDIIEHYPIEYQDLIEVIKHVFQKTVQEKEYAVTNLDPKNMAVGYSLFLAKYFGDCQQTQSCEISYKKYVYFLKDLAFFLTPLMIEYEDSETILIRPKLDFRATEILMKEVQNLKHVLGDSFNYEQIKAHSFEIVEKLFDRLKEEETSIQEEGEINEKKAQQRESVEQL